MKVSMFYLVFKLGIIIIKHLMNSAFIGEKELCRSRLVLSTEADWTPSSNCIILYIRRQPHSLVNNCLILSQLRQWFLSYLSNRSQRVALQGTYSYWLQVTSWVPHGLMLGLAHYSFSPISMIFPNASNMTLKSEKIKVSVSVISRSASRMLRLITLTETLIY